MSSGAQPAMSVIPISMEQLVELLSARVGQDHIEPLREELQQVSKDVIGLKAAVLGNGKDSLQRQIEKHGEQCNHEHEALHRRISDRRKLEPEAAAKPPRSEVKMVLLGAYLGLASTAGLLGFFFKIVEWMGKR